MLGIRHLVAYNSTIVSDGARGREPAPAPGMRPFVNRNSGTTVSLVFVLIVIGAQAWASLSRVNGTLRRIREKDLLLEYNPPSAKVLVGRGTANDVMIVELRNFKPGSAFDLSTIQRSNLTSHGNLEYRIHPVCVHNRFSRSYLNKYFEGHGLTVRCTIDDKGSRTNRVSDPCTMADDGLDPIEPAPTTEAKHCCLKDSDFMAPKDKGNADVKRGVEHLPGTPVELPRAYVPFDVDIDFSDTGGCKCDCCEYRQQIRGTIKRKRGDKWEVVKKQLPDGDLSAAKFKEDGAQDPEHPGKFVSPGHNRDSKDPNDIYTKNGCHYHIHDEPGYSAPQGTEFEIDLEFAGEVVDICNKNPKTKRPAVRARKMWKVKFSGTL